MIDKQIDKINIVSPNMNAQRLDDLRRIMPDLFDAEGQLDIHALHQLTQQHNSEGTEKWRFEWMGKRESKNRAFTPSRGTFIPDKKRSVNFDITKNLLIEADNLEALKLLNKTYFEQVKCIYIDPPYNTSSDFIYHDDFAEGNEAYWQKTGALQDGVKLVALTETSGRKHSKWLNMVQSRLYAARHLLRQDGVIVVHIDENEGHRLRMLLGEVFGNENFLGEVIWDKRNPKGDSGKIAYQHEAILFFAKNLAYFREHNVLKVPKKNAERMLKKAAYYYSLIGQKRVPPHVSESLQVLGQEVTEDHKKEYTLENANQDYQKWLDRQGTLLSRGEAMYKFIDNAGKVYQTVSMAWPNNKKAPEEYFIPLNHPLSGRPCPVPAKGWRNPPETMKKFLDRDCIVFGIDETVQPRRKYVLEENMMENLASLLYYGASDDPLLKKLGIPFENPKPVEVAKRLMTGVLDKDDIVMDFFAGSGTTGHAVMEMNAENGKDIRFILVQIPEHIHLEHSAYKAGYETISDLCIDRLKKAGELVNEQYSKSIDTGFRVFYLAESHFQENLFKPDPNKSDKENLSALRTHLELASQQRVITNEETINIITEISLKNGYGLFFKLRTIKDGFSQNTVYRLCGNGKEVLLCLDSDLCEETIDTFLKKYSDDQLILSDHALCTAKKWTLQNEMGDNVRLF